MTVIFISLEAQKHKHIAVLMGASQNRMSIESLKLFKLQNLDFKSFLRERD